MKKGLNFTAAKTVLGGFVVAFLATVFCVVIVAIISSTVAQVRKVQLAKQERADQIKTHIAIVGGGISGLYTAWLLASSDANVDVTVLEASATLGGCIHTEYATKDIPLYERGAFAVDASPHSHVLRLLELLKLQGKQTHAPMAKRPTTFQCAFSGVSKSVAQLLQNDDAQCDEDLRTCDGDPAPFYFKEGASQLTVGLSAIVRGLESKLTSGRFKDRVRIMRQTRVTGIVPVLGRKGYIVKCKQLCSTGGQFRMVAVFAPRAIFICTPPVAMHDWSLFMQHAAPSVNAQCSVPMCQVYGSLVKPQEAFRHYPSLEDMVQRNRVINTEACGVVRNTSLAGFRSSGYVRASLVEGPSAEALMQLWQSVSPLEWSTQFNRNWTAAFESRPQSVPHAQSARDVLALGDVRACFWPFGNTIWRPIPDANRSTLASLCVTPHLTKLPDIYQVNNLWSQQHPNTIEGALEACTQAHEAFLHPNRKRIGSLDKTCELVYDGRVLNVTRWMDNHPDQVDLIAPFLGGDGTDVMNRVLGEVPNGLRFVLGMQTGWLSKSARLALME